MANRITVMICGQEYTFVAEEDAAYMQKVAAAVDERMSRFISETQVGRNSAAVLTAVNLTDELFKAQETAENLRRQIKTYLDEAGAAKNEISDLKRQLFKYQNKSH